MQAPDKERLRAEFGAKRRARGLDDLVRARAAIGAHVLKWVFDAGYGCVAAYVPLRTEPGSAETLTAMCEQGVRVLVPVTLPDLDLDWVQWAPSELGPPLGRDAIGSAQLVLVPALSVARDGTRLGRGGGSYDRGLARCVPGTVAAALLFDDEVVDSLPRDPWDLPVGAVVTPTGRVLLGGC